jgi:choline kinase
MRGLVLAAGAGRRLHPETADIPKALIPVAGDDSILDLTLANFASTGIAEAAIVVGYRAEAIRERKVDLESRHGVRLHLIDNDKAEIWNNAYSLWCARDWFAEGTVLANGDTLHPASVERTLLDNRGPGLLLAIDTEKSLADEEMKVRLNDQGHLTRITKLVDPTTVQGEYIGVALIEASIADVLSDALQRTFEADPDLYYEDAFQLMADEGAAIATAPIGTVDWVEIDNHADLARAREIACRS